MNGKILKRNVLILLKLNIGFLIIIKLILVKMYPMDTLLLDVSLLGLAVINLICIYLVFGMEEDLIISTHEVRLLYWKSIENHIRRERHDYMNIFQIVYGYLQLKKPDHAIEQIKKATRISKNISKIYNLKCMPIALLLSSKLKEAENMGISLEIDLISEIEEDDYHQLNIYKMLAPMEKFLNRIIGELNIVDNKDSYVVIYEGKDFFKLSIYTEEIISDSFEDFIDIAEESFFFEGNTLTIDLKRCNYDNGYNIEKLLSEMMNTSEHTS